MGVAYSSCRSLVLSFQDPHNSKISSVETIGHYTSGRWRGCAPEFDWRKFIWAI